MVGFSISILSKGRIDCLTVLLSAIDRERRKNVDATIEVNLIDDSSVKDRVIVEQLCEQYGFNYYYYKGSIAAKRNEAIRRAKHEIIWFIDSDCEPCEGSLKAFIDSYKDNKENDVLGVVEFYGKKPLFWRLIEQAGYVTSFSFATFMDYAMWGPCANICFRKKDLESIGGFKESFPYNYSGEDVDVGVRLNKSGCSLKCNPKAVVKHNTSTWLSVGSFCRKVFRWGRTDFFLMRDHYDLTYPEYPRFIIILFLTCILALFPGISWLFPLTFLIVTPLLFWACQLLLERKHSSNILLCWLAFYLKQVFELGFVLECIRHFKFGFIFKKILYGDRQLSYEIVDKNCLALASLLSIMCALMVCLLIY